jgi:prepilin-type N-terminal cleavage/methylation domain-containing protein
MFAQLRDNAQFCGPHQWIPARSRTAADEKPLGNAECRRGRRPSSICGGFSLIELIVSTAILLIISGGIVTAISTSQQTYSRTEVKSAMYENVRGVAELMAQEIGQAGLVSLPATTISAAVTSSAVAQNVTVSSTTSMYLGEALLVDAGASEELVTLTNLTSTTITAICSKSHAVGAPITALGAFPYGIVTPGTTDGSTGTVLNLLGDINGDGTLVYVRYTCTTGTTAAPGTLTRSVTTITPGVNTLSASQNLLTTLVANPAPLGTTCFQYTTQPAVAGYTFTTGVGITLSVQTTSPDPQTNQYLTMTKSFLNLSPRNVLTAYELAGAGITSRLQATPANVTVY